MERALTHAQQTITALGQRIGELQVEATAWRVEALMLREAATRPPEGERPVLTLVPESEGEPA
jgi:hypothetical protein